MKLVIPGIMKKHIKGYKHLPRELEKTLSKEWVTRKLHESTQNLKSPMITMIWKFIVPKKIKVLLWSLVHKSLNNQEKLQRKLNNEYTSPSVCPCF